MFQSIYRPSSGGSLKTTLIIHPKIHALSSVVRSLLVLSSYNNPLKLDMFKIVETV
jgi:hypothetical protein